MVRPELRGLYAVTPDGMAEEQLLLAVEQALAGGARWVQFRDKQRPSTDRLALASALVGLCREHHAALIINDDVELAIAVGADGVHLGADDGDLHAARSRLGPARILGASCYGDLTRAARASAAGADYLAFGAVYASPTKPQAASAALTLFGDARRFGKPLVAIGGITLDNAPDVVRAGADLLAVITDLFQAPDLRRRAYDYQQLFCR